MHWGLGIQQCNFQFTLIGIFQYEDQNILRYLINVEMNLGKKKHVKFNALHIVYVITYMSIKNRCCHFAKGYSIGCCHYAKEYPKINHTLLFLIVMICVELCMDLFLIMCYFIAKFIEFEPLIKHILHTSWIPWNLSFCYILFHEKLIFSY